MLQIRDGCRKILERLQVHDSSQHLLKLLLHQSLHPRPHHAPSLLQPEHPPEPSLQYQLRHHSLQLLPL